MTNKQNPQQVNLSVSPIFKIIFTLEKENLIKYHNEPKFFVQNDFEAC